jgi:hypothetical protein
LREQPHEEKGEGDDRQYDAHAMKCRPYHLTPPAARDGAFDGVWPSPSASYVPKGTTEAPAQSSGVTRAGRKTTAHMTSFLVHRLAAH